MQGSPSFKQWLNNMFQRGEAMRNHKPKRILKRLWHKIKGSLKVNTKSVFFNFNMAKGYRKLNKIRTE
jgi:hypothetical protein